MSDKKIELIAQMLAKAEQTTPEEAEALTAAAEKLMVKYAIDQAVIDAKRAKAGQPAEKIITQIIHFKGAYRLELLNIGHCVGWGMGSVRTLQKTVGNKLASLYLIGYESDVQQAVTLINSLQIQGMVAVRAFWKAHKHEYDHLPSYDQEASRRSFLKGFGNGAGNRILTSRNIIVEEAGTGTELVLVDRRKKVDEHISSTMNVGTARARGGKSDGYASSAGFRAGQQANTGGKAVSQGRGISA